MFKVLAGGTIGGVVIMLFLSTLLIVDGQGPSLRGGTPLACQQTPEASTSFVQDKQCLSGGQIAASAQLLASHLSGNPSVWYDEMLPEVVLSYWERLCPTASACWPYWQNGNLQCVLFVAGTFALAGEPLPALGNAIDFWTLYANRPGWQQILSGVAASVDERGLPQPGDIMVWTNQPPGVGHVAIVLSVLLPEAGRAGSVTFAQANGPLAITTQPLLFDRQVVTWPGYIVYGYLRPMVQGEVSTNDVPDVT